MATPQDWMKEQGKTQTDLAPRFGITQQALSMKLNGERPWKKEEALLWEDISGGAVTRNDVLFPEDSGQTSNAG